MHWPESTTRRPVRTYSPRIDSIGQKPRALMRGSSEVAMRTLLIAESALLALAGCHSFPRRRSSSCLGRSWTMVGTSSVAVLGCITHVGDCVLVGA